MTAKIDRFRKLCLLLITGTFIIIVMLQVRSTDHSILHKFANVANISAMSSYYNSPPAAIPRHWSNEISRKKITHVNFLKVHKAGSTTVHNIMLRFGNRYDLNILLPQRGNYFRNAGSAVKIPPKEHFDIFAIHTIYDQNLFDKLLPNDTVNIAIVREPVERFVSAAYYYRDVFKHAHLLKVPRLNFIHELVKHPDLYETNPYSVTKNAMGRDFGFKSSIKYNEIDKINAKLEYLDKQFSLVMIMEKFDESLILLRRLLNWSHLDIIYLQSNSNKHKPIILSPAEVTVLRHTCFMDFAIYEYFEKRFEEKMERVSDDFPEELNHFRNILVNVKDFCAESQEGDVLHFDTSIWSDGFDLTATECKNMAMKELRFIKIIRKAQYDRHKVKY